MALTALDQLLTQVDGEQQSLPPLDQWNPELSGDMDMRIDKDGRWFHEGGEIERHKLVKLFASILRFEADHGFVLVTPVEKWKIAVAAAPFVGIDVEVEVETEGEQVVWLRTNVDEIVRIDCDHPLRFEQGVPLVQLRKGVDVRLNRACYYHLAEFAYEEKGEFYLRSAGQQFALPS
ncbi:hypothetical protein SIN8267_00427 [Sinobacterium norvegicum]|uniref:DUF1285 domain-containing protein n=1 Tax=Sinobacterium norvegicum TaxID=1641715 RepID=A0ABM9ABH6_9GAMM|nr:DUF1285 domain-containing protein [Sinobacterium norvegicum]CAH0990335.1 hypothetical protein SIN8267_00427 [Sinobacterium norvegicum]